VAALVAETDLTLLMFGGGLVVIVFVGILGAIFVCRRHNFNHSNGGGNGTNGGSQLLKYSLHPAKTNNNGNGVHSVHKSRDR
jgi:hypothetical protein